jgi:hypothetical protein|nr:MAG TPA: hypothetical protein [Caudoviricetes sp.]
MSDLILKTLETRELKLNTMQLRGFYGKKMRRGSGGGSSGDGFPQLPGDVTRWHFGGLTNEMMAAMDDPRIEDADHKGRFLSFKNFLWAGMSGVGGYETYQSVYKFTFDLYANTCISKTRDHVNLTFKVTGLQPGNSLSLAYFGTTNTVYGTWTKDGVYTVNSKVTEVGKPLIFYNGYGSTRGEFTIEIFPLYPGALVFDGVDDYGICENFPILTKEKGYTVVALRQFLGSRNSFLISNRATGTAFSNGAFVFERFWDESGAIFYNFGTPSDQLSLKPDSPFSYLTSKSYNGRTTNAGDAVPSNTLLVGKSIINDSNSTNAAIWEICILDHDATEEELQKIQDYYKQEYPWLFPDQAWTVVGKTNEDTDRATIANITGNGNNLVLSNLGFIEGSGYNEEGEYAGYLVTDGVDDKIQSSAFTVGKDWTTVGEWEFLKEDAIKIAGIAKFGSFRFYNYSLTGRMNVYINAELGTNVVGNSIKAATSKGSVYLDFNSLQKITPGDTVDFGQMLMIGHNGTNYTKMAFKNLAIYPTVLSKEDCIKSYIYLQTLKAKI